MEDESKEISLKWKEMERAFCFFKKTIDDWEILTTYDVNFFEEYMKNFLKEFKELYFNTKNFLNGNVK